MLLQEVHNPNYSIKISDYKLYHRPLPGITQGGTVNYIKQHIPNYAVQQTTYTGLDYTGILIQLPHINIIFVSLYVRHLRHFPINDLTHLSPQNTHCFIAGDYNARNQRWKCHSTTRRVSSLHNLTSYLQLGLHAPNTPTHFVYDNYRPSTIDFAISKNLSFPITTTIINDLSSGHLPVCWSV